MKRDKLKKALIGVAKDVLIAFTIVCIVMLCLYAYCGIWPPMVVVESKSMQHSDSTSHIGVIDTGDMVFVKKVNATKDVVTYVCGEEVGYRKYGSFGDVIIYRPNGDPERVPIIHRAVIWIEANTSRCRELPDGAFDYDNFAFDVPSMGKYNTTKNFALERYGYTGDVVIIDLENITKSFRLKGAEPHGGYITKGDHNSGPDQPTYEPVLPEWIVGKAFGELPWFGLIKLKFTGAPLNDVPRNSWTGLFVTVALLLFIPLLFDILQPRVARWRKGKKSGKAFGPDGAGEEAPPKELPAPEGGSGESATGQDSEPPEELPPKEAPSENREPGEAGAACSPVELDETSQK